MVKYAGNEWTNKEEGERLVLVTRLRLKNAENKAWIQKIAMHSLCSIATIAQ